jgi:hypothetical protein
MLAYTERVDHVLALWNCLHDACIVVSELWKPPRNQEYSVYDLFTVALPEGAGFRQNK